jgi:hypothetical protein
MKDETYSSAQYNETPSGWQNPPTASPSDVSDPKVTKLHLAYDSAWTEMSQEIALFTKEGLECCTFSAERQHYQYLLASICKSNAPDDLRKEALRGLLKTSDWDFITTIPGYQEVIKEAVGMESN